MEIPLGFRFEPTDEELIRGFLFPKATGGALPWNGVVERKIYGAEAAPWLVFRDVEEPGSMYWQSKKEGGATKKTTYVFTTLMGAPKSKRIPRTAGGGGTWSGQTAPKKIKCSESGATIGVSKMFVYESTKFDVTQTSELGHWIMHEYSLSGVGLERAGLTACDLVLCKITRSIKKSVPPRPRLVDVPVPPQLNEDYDHVWTAAEASNKRARARARAEEGWNQEAEEESSRCSKKHKLGLDSNGEGEGFSDGLVHDGPGVVAPGEEAEGDDYIDVSWLLDEMGMATGGDVQDQYAGDDVQQESAGGGVMSSIQSFHSFLNQPEHHLMV